MKPFYAIHRLFRPAAAAGIPPGDGIPALRYICQRLFFPPAVLALLLLAAAPARAGGLYLDGKNMVFLDIRKFDVELSELLKTEPERVEARFLDTVSASEVPQRLDKWLFVIEFLRGDVTLKPDPDRPSTKILGDIAVSLAVGSYFILRDALLYRPALNYDATVYYDGGDGNLTRIVFTKRSSPIDLWPFD